VRTTSNKKIRVLRHWKRRDIYRSYVSFGERDRGRDFLNPFRILEEKGGL
jgi:hypothetical protein